MIQLTVESPDRKVRPNTRKITERCAIGVTRIGGIADACAGIGRAGSSPDQKIHERWKVWLPEHDARQIRAHRIAAKFRAGSHTVLAVRPGDLVGSLILIFPDIHSEDAIPTDDKLIGDAQGSELVDLGSKSPDANLRIRERD